MKANQNLKASTEAVSPVIGVILMVAITVVLAAVVFTIVSQLSTDQEPTPTLSMSQKGDVLTVVRVVGDVSWDQLTVSGCTGTVPTVGDVTAGDELTGCGDTVKIVHTPSNSLVWNS